MVDKKLINILDKQLHIECIKSEILEVLLWEQKKQFEEETKQKNIIISNKILIKFKNDLDEKSVRRDKSDASFINKIEMHNEYEDKRSHISVSKESKEQQEKLTTVTNILAELYKENS